MAIAGGMALALGAAALQQYLQDNAAALAAELAAARATVQYPSVPQPTYVNVASFLPGNPSGGSNYVGNSLLTFPND
jgi:hypothetical protein